MRYRGFPQIRDMHGDPVLASKLGFAKTLVGVAQSIQGRTGKHHVRLRREVDGVAVEVLVFGDQSVISLTHLPTTEERLPAGFAKLVWMPEGFLIYPKSPEYPKGWGLPFVDGEMVTPDADGLAEGGALPLVLVNRLRNNNYPDQFAPSHFPVPFFYMPWEEGHSKSIGVQDPPVNGELPDFRPQFSVRWQQLIREEAEEPADGEAATWYAHWPEVVKLGDVRQGILDKTNEVRDEADLPPLFPPLRGVYHGVGALIVRQMGMTGVQAHNYEGYRPGHTMTAERVIDRSAFWFVTAAGENLLTMRPIEDTQPGRTETPYEAGRRMAELWETSPGHRANMLRDYHPEDTEEGIPAIGFMHIGLGKGTTHTWEDPSSGALVELDPPSQGWQASQVMYGTTRLLLGYKAYWRGDAGTVSWHGAASCKYSVAARPLYFLETEVGMLPGAWAEWATNRSVLAVSGRMKPAYIVGEELVTTRGVVSAALHFSENDGLRLRVCTVTEEFLLELWDGPAHASWKEFSVLASFDLAAEFDGAEAARYLRRPIFSPDGAKCLVTLDRRILRTAPAMRQRLVNFNAPPDGEVVICGSVRDFVEFAGDSFTHIHRSAVDITPETISTADLGPGPEDLRRNEYVETCAETFRWLGDYDAGNSLVWANVRVDMRVEQWAEYEKVDDDYFGTYALPDAPDAESQQTKVTFEQTIEFPDGSEMATAQWDLTDWRIDGFSMILHTLDILRPENTGYSKILLRNVAEDDDRPSMGVELWWRGEKLKEKEEITWGADGEQVPNGLWWKGATWAGGVVRAVVLTGYNTPIFYWPFAKPAGVAFSTYAAYHAATALFPAQRDGDRSRSPYPAALTSTVWSVLHRGLHACSQATCQIAPAIFADADDEGNTIADLNMWDYDGEMILSGRYVTPLSRFAQHGFWEPEEDRMLWRATFDLAAAVGKPLGNDIEPVGVV